VLEAHGYELTPEDRRVLQAVQDGLPICERPYAAKAQELGISERELLDRLRRLRQREVIRRMAASIAHRKAGAAANAMCVWRVPPSRLAEVGCRMAERREVSHCYARKAVRGWRYNLYTMIHARTRRACLELIRELSRAVGIEDFVVLFSERELKKTWTRI